MTTCDTTDPIPHLARLIESIDIAMLTTSDASGQLESRPMVTQKSVFDGTLWFFVGRSSHLVACIERQPLVNVSYSDPAKQRYVSVSGSSTVIDHYTKRHDLWRSEYASWFPKGVDDPDLVLLRIQVDHADYWESSARIIVRLAGFAQSILGVEREDLTTSHGHLDL